MRPLLTLPAALAFVSWARTALGCPRCEVGVAARQQVLEDVFPHLLVSALPFVLVGLASVWADRLGRRDRPDKAGKP